MFRTKMLAAIGGAFLATASMAVADIFHLEATISYRERILLPEEAVLEVELLDTSRADAPSIRMASQRFRLGGVPRRVEIAYDSDLIDDRHTYTVAAKILLGDEVLFRSTTAYMVLTRGAPDKTEIVLEAMPVQADMGDADDQSIYGETWTIYEVTGRLLVTEDLPVMMIDEEGNFGLYAGCNNFAGSLTAEDGVLTMPAAFAGTKKLCEEGKMTLEQDIIDALSVSTGYVRNDQILAFTNDAGVTVLRMQITE
ncbi:putative lipoprotein [Cognatiyoonia sediminum]|uniref:Putative lipoprotein n=1 Tax=Cognatiyoonia sediminum TaxID=1508389 RepID=A0A1M5LFP6_9RHOB|nr:YbaY family lipoprotein [Cognatiyoonia sediminum]SHG63944.1 putative lipoprotein [Cognatiyoonia sediminum]